MDIFSSEVQASFHNLLLTKEKLWEPAGAANEPYLSSLLTSRFVWTLLSAFLGFQLLCSLDNFTCGSGTSLSVCRYLFAAAHGSNLVSAKVLGILKGQEIIHGKDPLLHIPSPKCFQNMREGLETDLKHVQLWHAPGKLFGNCFYGCNCYVVPEITLPETDTRELFSRAAFCHQSRAISETHRYRIWSKSVVSSSFFLGKLFCEDPIVFTTGHKLQLLRPRLPPVLLCQCCYI